MLIAEVDGRIDQPSERGPFFHHTRLIGERTVTVDRRPCQMPSSAATARYGSQVVMIIRALPKDDGEMPTGSLSLGPSRLLCLGGMRETAGDERRLESRPSLLRSGIVPLERGRFVHSVAEG